MPFCLFGIDRIFAVRVMGGLMQVDFLHRMIIIYWWRKRAGMLFKMIARGETIVTRLRRCMVRLIKGIAGYARVFSGRYMFGLYFRCVNGAALNNGIDIGGCLFNGVFGQVTAEILFASRRRFDHTVNFVKFIGSVRRWFLV